jgi:hypothetical protein
MSTDREAFDLHIKACRNNFKRRVKQNWKKLWWWKLIITDTLNNVCAK